jgi:Holliday junction resolvasome RuvABC DNA-binding subunit
MGSKTQPLPKAQDEDAALALQTLGYSEKEAREKLAKIREKRPELAVAATEDLVKAVLQM